MKSDDIKYTTVQPDESLRDFIQAFWSIESQPDSNMPVVVIPTGSLDVFFYRSDDSEPGPHLIGLETKPKTIELKSVFAISFKPLAAEYLLRSSVADLLDGDRFLPLNFLSFNEVDVTDFYSFCISITQKMKSILPQKLDERKRKLFELIFNTNGAMPVKELAKAINWSTQQINRYFNNQFGLSVKAYSNVIRFHASFRQIREGRLFPEENFADQSHFIKEVKKLSGVSPKVLYKNQNERFIQFSLLPR